MKLASVQPSITVESPVTVATLTSTASDVKDPDCKSTHESNAESPPSATANLK